MKTLITFLSLVFLVGCSTQLKYEMSNVKLLTPEAKGKLLKGDLGMSVQQTHKVVLTEVIDSLIFNYQTINKDKSIENGGDVSFLLNLGLLEQVDFYLHGGKLGLKYQFYGSNQLERNNDYKAAVALAYGSEDSGSHSYVTSNNSSTRSYSTDMNVVSTEIAFLFGRRTTKNHLYYTTLFYDSYNYEGTLTSTQFNPILAKGKSTNLGWLVGYELSNESVPNVFMKLESGVVQGRVESYAKKTSGVFGLNINMGW